MGMGKGEVTETAGAAFLLLSLEAVLPHRTVRKMFVSLAGFATGAAELFLIPCALVLRCTLGLLLATCVLFARMHDPPIPRFVSFRSRYICHHACMQRFCIFSPALAVSSGARVVVGGGAACSVAAHVFFATWCGNNRLFFGWYGLAVGGFHDTISYSCPLDRGGLGVVGSIFDPEFLLYRLPSEEIRRNLLFRA